jgi:tetratricopeptide (TPR) repeat protein
MKQDEMSARLAAGMDFYKAHKKRIALIVAVSVGVLAVGLGIFFYIRSQQNRAGAAFAKALNTFHAPVYATPPEVPNLESYKTAEEKNETALAAFNAVAKEYSSYSVGRLGRYYAAICLREMEKYPEAEKEFLALSQMSDAKLASLAKVGLASVYELTDRSADAEKIYKELEEHPTETVPKVTALTARADLYRQTKAPEASSIYQQIQKEYPGTPAADYATQMLTGIPQ